MARLANSMQSIAIVMFIFLTITARLLTAFKSATGGRLLFLRMEVHLLLLLLLHAAVSISRLHGRD